jgi:hypothetical protein
MGNDGLGASVSIANSWSSPIVARFGPEIRNALTLTLSVNSGFRIINGDIE